MVRFEGVIIFVTGCIRSESSQFRIVIIMIVVVTILVIIYFNNNVKKCDSLDKIRVNICY
jgi:hypothetical protein